MIYDPSWISYIPLETSPEIDLFSLGSKDNMPWTPWWQLPDLVGDVSRKAVVKHSRPPLADNQWFLFIGKSTCNSSFRRDLNEIFVIFVTEKSFNAKGFFSIPKHLLVSHHINSLALGKGFYPKTSVQLFTFPMAGLGVTHGSDRIWYLLVGFLVLCPNSWDLNCHLETSSYICTTKDW